MCGNDYSNTVFVGEYHGNLTPGKIFYFLFFSFFFLFRAAVGAYGSSKVGGQIGAAAVGLYHSHSNVGSELQLQPTPKLKAMLDALTH